MKLVNTIGSLNLVAIPKIMRIAKEVFETQHPQIAANEEKIVKTKEPKNICFNSTTNPQHPMTNVY